MDKFWKAALSVAGIGAIAFFVFFSLYKQWLTLPIFPELTQNQAFTLMMVFLTLTFGALVVGVAAWFFKSGSVQSEDAALNRLEQSWKGISYINCDSLVGPDVEKASNALQMTSMYWRNGFLNKKLIFDQYGTVFIEIFEQIDGCDKQVPGYNKPLKFCKDFLSPLIRTTYNEIKKYASSHQ